MLYSWTTELTQLRYKQNLVLGVWGGRHSSVVSSAPTILLPRV